MQPSTSLPPFRWLVGRLQYLDFSQYCCPSYETPTLVSAKTFFSLNIPAFPGRTAGHGKRLGNWYPSSSSINALLASSLSTLRTRSHDIVRKNPYAANAIDSIVSNCIGTGIKPQSKAKDQDFRRRIQDLWLSWTDEADSAGGVDFYGFQSLVLRSVIECGECFVRLKIDKKNATVPLKLQVLESEHLDSSKDQALQNCNHISRIRFRSSRKRFQRDVGPADVGGTYEVFRKQQLRAISVGFGITYEQLTGDLSDQRDVGSGDCITRVYFMPVRHALCCDGRKK
ncbi:hypothetical protein FACS189472_13170 [Alphaproteobacteria bacterium]|nr:hypothetical protein FACS189472_13170 [Alphaproteobacteria bacterium]